MAISMEKAAKLSFFKKALPILKSGKKALKPNKTNLAFNRLPYNVRKKILSSPVKTFIKEPKHYKNKSTGSFARLSREIQYREKPQSPFLLGLLMPRSAKTKWNRTMRHIDERLGEIFSRPGKKKGLFVKKEYIRVPGTNKYKKHYYSSITAPIGKTTAFVAPALASMYIMDKMQKAKNKKKPKIPDNAQQIYYNGYEPIVKISNAKEDLMSKTDKVLIPRTDLEKTAAALKHAKLYKDKICELEKTASETARAEKLAYSLVEKGKIAPFRNYEEFREKVASLASQDLNVVEKALEFDTGALSIGDIGNNQKGSNALEQFVLED